MFPFPEVAVDDLEYVLGIMFGNDLELATMNATWVPLDTGRDRYQAEVARDLPWNNPNHDVMGDIIEARRKAYEIGSKGPFDPDRTVKETAIND